MPSVDQQAAERRMLRETRIVWAARVLCVVLLAVVLHLAAMWWGEYTRIQHELNDDDMRHLHAACQNPHVRAATRRPDLGNSCDILDERTLFAPSVRALAHTWEYVLNWQSAAVTYLAAVVWSAVTVVLVSGVVVVAVFAWSHARRLRAAKAFRDLLVETRK